jgi:predicted ester cyclase
MSEENKALVRRVMESWNKRNMTLMDDLLDPGYVYHGVVEGKIAGVEAMKQFLTSLYAVWPDVQHVIQEQLAEGDKVVTRFKSTGTPQVEFMGVKPSGKSATVDEVTISRIAGGRIVEDWNTWDFLGLLRQLGAAPESTEANKALFRRMCEEEDKGNVDVFDEVCSPGFTVHFAGSAEALTRDQLKPVVRSFYAAFPDIHHEFQDLIAADDRVAARLTLPGTHQGEWQGIAPTGKHVVIDDLVIARFSGGKLAEMWVHLDGLGLLQQLGAAPPLGKGEEKAAA